MEGTRAVGVFCDDIREEKSGQDTIIGILPDNMKLSQIPGVLPKLGIYIRIHIDPKNPPKEIRARLSTPWGQDFDVGHVDHATIATALKQAAVRDLPLAGIVLKAILAPFAFNSGGLATVSVIFDGKESVCAMLNLIAVDAPTSATASPPPS